MHYDNLDIIAPALLKEDYNEAEVLGSAVWLWMHSDSHRNAPLHMLSTLLLPAIKSQQFVLASENEKPVFYLSWAAMNQDAERRYLRNMPQCMPIEDWTSGERIWFLDWVAPSGHSQRMRELMKQRLFPDCCARFLYHRDHEKGLRIMTFHGINVTPEEATLWFRSHPHAFDTPAEHDQPTSATIKKFQVRGAGSPPTPFI